MSESVDCGSGGSSGEEGTDEEEEDEEDYISDENMKDLEGLGFNFVEDDQVDHYNASHDDRLDCKHLFWKKSEGDSKPHVPSLDNGAWGGEWQNGIIKNQEDDEFSYLSGASLDSKSYLGVPPDGTPRGELDFEDFIVKEMLVKIEQGEGKEERNVQWDSSVVSFNLEVPMGASRREGAAKENHERGQHGAFPPPLTDEMVITTSGSIVSNDGEEEDDDPLQAQLLQDCTTDRKKKAILKFCNNFQKLKDYKDEHGNCNVPQTYPKDRPLGNWVNKMRSQKTCWDRGLKSFLDAEKIAILDSIGFEWAKPKKEVGWETRFKQLLRFQEQHGHVNVPTRKKSWPSHDDDSRNLSALGRWVTTQRTEYKKFQKGKRSLMTADRIYRLESIGFLWSVQKNAAVKGKRLVAPAIGNCN